MPRRSACVRVSIALVASLAAAGAAGARTAPAAEIAVEIESLIGASARASGGAPIVQDMRGFGDAWGGGAQLFWRPPEPGGARAESEPRLTLDISVAAAGEYEVVLAYTVAPDFGRFRVLVSGEIAAEVDGYHPDVQHREVSVGRHAVSAGTLEIGIEVVGRNDASTGYIVGLDRLVLQPVTAPADPDATPGARRQPRLRPATAPTAPPADVPAAAKLARAVLGARSLAQPKLEVFSDSLGFDTRGAHLDWKAPLLRPRFRWHPSATGASLAVWELSLAPFPADSRAATPPLLASGKTARADAAETAEFEIDLAPHAPKDKRIGKPGAPLPPFDPGTARPYVYVRVRAIDTAGAPIGRPSNEVKLFFGKTGKIARPKPGENRPRVRLISYRPPRPYAFDFQCHGVALQDVVALGMKVIAKGQKGNLCKKKDKDFLDDLSDAVGSVVDLVSSAIDWAATAYAAVKSSALGAVVDGLKASGVGCGGECQFAMGTALDAGLAAAGMPPSLPEFDQLVAGLQQDGIDALAGQLAEAAASQGVPEVVAQEAAKQAANELVAKAKQMAKSGGGGGSKGVWRIDPAGIYSPAVVVLEATNLHPTRDSDPVYVQLQGAFSGHAGLFRASGVNLPALAPGRSLRFAFEPEPTVWEAGWMDFLPELSDCPPGGPLSPGVWIQCFQKKREEAKAKLEEWVALYTHHDHVFRIQTSIGPKSEKVAELRCAGAAPSCDVHFANPMSFNRRLDVCREFGKSCGDPAALTFCQHQGYGRLVGFERADDIGDTRTIGDGKLCDGKGCDGFARISCAP
jgi:hypothetical protein